MRRIVYTLVVVSGVTGFILWSQDPLNDTVNFIIGGTIPGTKNALGFWPMLGMIFVLLWLLARFIRNLKLQMLEHTAHQIVAEKARDEFAESYSTKDTALQKAILGQHELTTEI